MMTQIFKKLLVSMLVCSMSLVPTLVIASELHAPAPVVAESGDDMALLKAAVEGDASFEAIALASGEMKKVEGASRASRWWRNRSAKTKSIIVGVLVAGACVVITGATAGAGFGTCTIAF